MQTDPLTTPQYRVEHRPLTGGPIVLTAGMRLREVAHALDAHRSYLADRGRRGTMVLVCEIQGQDSDLVVRTIGPRLETRAAATCPQVC